MGRIVRSVIRLGDPVMFMGAWGTALLIALFVLYPVFRVLPYPSATDFLAVLDHPRWLRAIVNTLVMTTLSTVTACLLGFVFALALTRPDLPGKGLFRTISILPLFSPPFAVAFSYLLLFGRLGLITHTVFHLRVDILGWRGLWLSQTISFFPIATLAISRVLENIPPSIEFVARNLGADEVSVFRTVTAPLARPGVAAAMLLVVLVAFCSLVAIFVGLIYAGIVIGSLTRVWGADWHPTLRHWAEAVKRWPHVQNSLVVSGGAGVMAACLGFVTAYVARGRAVAGGAILGAGAVMPAAIPGVFLGIGYLLAFNGPPIPLAGTIWILILALSFWNLPFAYKTTAAGFRQIDRALEEAASNLGASWLRVLTDVYLPLLKRTDWVAFIATFVNSVTNLSITMFLVTARDVVATVSILALVSDNRLGVGAALTTF